MLDVKEAAQRASEYFAGLYSGQSLSDVRLEEVEQADHGKYWLITLSYPVLPGLNLGKKEYKVFKIDAKTGEVKSMKIRKLDCYSCCDDFAKRIPDFEEHYTPSARVSSATHFNRLGLTDSGIADLVKGNYLVLTDDFPLAGYLENRQIDVINFNNLRSLTW